MGNTSCLPPPSSVSAQGEQLPPGQHAVEGFPRFGTHLHRPPPPVPADPAIRITGVVTEEFTVPLGDLAELPRRQLIADFHCVAGWSATGLRWEGVGFETFYRLIIVPALPRNTSVTHLVFGGLDGYRSIVEVEDVLADDVLIADRLDGMALDPDHGAPVRLVSPSQYGFVSTKHLCRIEVHATRPTEKHAASISVGPLTVRTPLIHPHPRARVRNEERHRYLPGWALRPIYRLLTAPLVFLGARGSRRVGTPT